MLGQAVDALGQERDLHLGRTGIAFVGAELLDQALFAVKRQRHRGASNRHVPEMTPRGGFQKTFFCQQIREEGTTGSLPSKGTAQSRRRASATSASICVLRASTDGKRRSSRMRDMKVRVMV